MPMSASTNSFSWRPHKDFHACKTCFFCFFYFLFGNFLGLAMVADHVTHALAVSNVEFSIGEPARTLRRPHQGAQRDPLRGPPESVTVSAMRDSSWSSARHQPKAPHVSAALCLANLEQSQFGPPAQLRLFGTSLCQKSNTPFCQTQTACSNSFKP